MTMSDLLLSLGVLSIPLTRMVTFGQVEFNDDLFSHEELTVIGILTGLILWLVWERRHFITNAGEQLTEMEKRLTTLEREFISIRSRGRIGFDAWN